MSLEITQRPQRDLYVNNPPETYEESYYNSRWVSAHLPIQYKISNTKFPENSEDDVDSICAVTDYNGFAKISLCGTYETYVGQEYIKVEDCTVNSYNGVWQILNVINATTVVIGAAYDGDATGTIQRYYNAYHNLIKVYAGIPAYHQYTSEDPLSLIATLKIVPNTSNIAIVDISGLIKSKVNCDNDLDQISLPNDLNAWTGFYIEYTEAYDVSDGNEISLFTSEYTVDSVQDCVAGELITNGTFTTNLNGWSQSGIGSAFVYDSDKASSTKGANLNSQFIYQAINLVQGINYEISVTCTNSEANQLIVYVLFEGETLITENITGTQVVAFNIVPSIDYSSIGFLFQFGGSSTQKGSLDNISAMSEECTYFGFAINGTRQFQNSIGGNFGDYVQNFNENVYLNKFLTNFTNPIWFNGLYFDLSTIIPKSTFDIASGTLLYFINEYTEGGGFIQDQVIELESKDDGVYRLPLSDLVLDPNTENFDIQIYQIPQNRLTDGNNGTFEFSSNPSGTPPSDWGISLGTIGDTLTRSNSFFHSGANSLRSDIGGSSPGSYSVWLTTTNIAVEQNKDYIIEGYVLNNIADPSLYGSQVYISAIGIVPTLVIPYTISSEMGVWNYIKTIFNSGSNTNITIQANITVLNSIAGFSDGIYFDDITVKGPVENLSEIKNIKVDNSCTKQNIYLTWLNDLGA
jgi:hypothetical protein